MLEWKYKGTGVPEEKLPRIFDRFYRCDEARTIKGSGAGLYIVKYIMERHGGTAEAENDDGLKIQLYFPERSQDGEDILFEKIWGYDYISDGATVSVHINRLREKIEDDARNPKIIETVWGAGYRLNL